MKLTTVILVCLRAVWIILNNLYSIPSFLVWMLLLQPVRLVNPALYWKVEGTMFNWLLCHVAHWVQSAGYTVLESGRDPSPLYGDEALVIPNHQSTADVPVIMTCFSCKKGVTAGMMWIMDRILMYTDFGWVCLLHGDFFIQQGTGPGRSDQMTLLENHINTVYQSRPRKWIVLFPEGGFLRKRRLGSQKFAKANSFPVLNHVALPRVGAMQTILSNLHPHNAQQGKKTIKWVIDMTIAYPSGKPLDAMRFAGGWEEPAPTHVYYRVFPIEDIPSGREELQEWLFDLYTRKEELLENFYKTGKFFIEEFQTSDDIPGGAMNERVVRYSNVFLWSLHVFFIASAICQYYSLRFLSEMLF